MSWDIHIQITVFKLNYNNKILPYSRRCELIQIFFRVVVVVLFNRSCYEHVLKDVENVMGYTYTNNNFQSKL